MEEWRKVNKNSLPSRGVYYFDLDTAFLSASEASVHINLVIKRQVDIIGNTYEPVPRNKCSVRSISCRFFHIFKKVNRHGIKRSHCV